MMDGRDCMQVSYICISVPLHISLSSVIHDRVIDKKNFASFHVLHIQHL